ncbi:MAG: hypothetical protein AAFV30_01810, partial [Pseudomonadota bacterium]
MTDTATPQTTTDTGLSQHVLDEIDRWRQRFPADQSRSAIIGALHAAQHENHGYGTQPPRDAIAEVLGLEPI